MSSDGLFRDPSIGVHRFSDRIAGRPADDVLRPDVSVILQENLHSWVDEFAGNSIPLRTVVSRAFDRLDLHDKRAFTLDGMQLLDLVDQILELASDWSIRHDETLSKRCKLRVFALRSILQDARSLYTVIPRDGGGVMLATRVDPTLRAAVDREAGTATSAAAHLRLAWSALHKLEPDPAIAYREAVKALEATLAPLVLPNDQAPTLGKVKTAIMNGGWKFSLDRTGPPGKTPAISESASSSVTFLVDLIERVYGSEARHGEGGVSRKQSQEEAAAAVYSALAVMGWVSAGAITK